MQGPTALLVPQSGLRSFSASGGIQLLATLGPQQQQAAVQTGRVGTAINNTRPVGTANILPAVSVAGSHFTANDFTLLLTPTPAPILTSSTPTNSHHPLPPAALNVKVKVPPASLPPTTNASHVTSSMSQARSKFVSSLARSREVSIPLVTSSAGTTGAVTSQLVAAVLGSARMPRPKTIPILKTAQPANTAFRYFRTYCGLLECEKSNVMHFNCYLTSVLCVLHAGRQPVVRALLLNLNKWRHMFFKFPKMYLDMLSQSEAATLLLSPHPLPLLPLQLTRLVSSANQLSASQQHRPMPLLISYNVGVGAAKCQEEGWGVVASKDTHL